MNGNDVLMLCTRCYRPVFNQSRNAMPDGSKKNVDNSPRLRHKKCPERPELWEPVKP